MAIHVKSISLDIEGCEGQRSWNIKIGGDTYHFDNFALHHGLLTPSSLTFTLVRDPEEDSNDPLINVCGIIIGKAVILNVQTTGLKTQNEDGSLTFKGFSTEATGSRNGTEY